MAPFTPQSRLSPPVASDDLPLPPAVALSCRQAQLIPTPDSWDPWAAGSQGSTEKLLRTRALEVWAAAACVGPTQCWLDMQSSRATVKPENPNHQA